jgi:hypothetical protein
VPPPNILHPIIIDNANPSRITATAGTHIGKGFFFGYIIFLANKRTLQFIKNCLHSRTIAGSRVSALSKIPYCCSVKRVGTISIPMWLIIR